MSVVMHSNVHTMCVCMSVRVCVCIACHVVCTTLPLASQGAPPPIGWAAGVLAAGAGPSAVPGGADVPPGSLRCPGAHQVNICTVTF